MKAAADEAQRALPSASSRVASPAADALAATAASAVQPQRVQRRRGGSSRLLTSSLELEPGLRNHWFPAHFSSVSYASCTPTLGGHDEAGTVVGHRDSVDLIAFEALQDPFKTAQTQALTVTLLMYAETDSGHAHPI